MGQLHFGVYATVHGAMQRQSWSEEIFPGCVGEMFEVKGSQENPTCVCETVELDATKAQSICTLSTPNGRVKCKWSKEIG